MVAYRRYLIASSLARLIRKERGGNRITEGHFPNQADRSSFVIVDGDKGSLVLVHSSGPNGPVEERTDVPRAHAEALLDVTPGKIDYLLTHLTVGTRDVQIARFVTPGPLDMIAVSFESEEEARDFRPLSWFGPDITSDVAYQNRAIALNGAPQVPEVPLTNAALNSLLDTLENRYGTGRAHAPQPRNTAEVEITQSAASTASSERSEPGARARSSKQQSQPASTDVEIAEDENNDLNLSIEDNVIRELARSLRPQRR